MNKLSRSATTAAALTILALDSGQDTAVDSGQYTSYAEPVYVNGRGHCLV
ncbi:hypothetical protein [Streptomyces sp. NPDC047043]